MDSKRQQGKFAKGHKGYKPKGAKSEKTQLWHELKDFIMEEGSAQFMTEMKQLKGEKYVNAFLKTLEFFQPKLSRSEVQPLSIDTILEMPPEERRRFLTEKINGHQ